MVQNVSLYMAPDESLTIFCSEEGEAMTMTLYTHQFTNPTAKLNQNISLKSNILDEKKRKKLKQLEYLFDKLSNSCGSMINHS